MGMRNKLTSPAEGVGCSKANGTSSKCADSHNLYVFVAGTLASLSILICAGFRYSLGRPNVCPCERRCRGPSGRCPGRLKVEHGGPVREDWAKHHKPLPLNQGGPMYPKRFLICGLRWQTREIEISHACVADISFPSPSSTAWCLPASKTDAKAVGAVRRLSCICVAEAPAPCPCCTLKAQWAWAQTGACPDAPLFPTVEGRHALKAQAVCTIRIAAIPLRLPLVAPSGANRFGGHSLRRGGVQFLGQAGVCVWHIQLTSQALVKCHLQLPGQLPPEPSR